MSNTIQSFSHGQKGHIVWPQRSPSRPLTSSHPADSPHPSPHPPSPSPLHSHHPIFSAAVTSLHRNAAVKSQEPFLTVPTRSDPRRCFYPFNSTADPSCSSVHPSVCPSVRTFLCRFTLKGAARGPLALRLPGVWLWIICYEG